jgi:hypothetical protein
MLAMVRGIGPKDEIEAMMAAQMAAVHMTTKDEPPPRRQICRGQLRTRSRSPTRGEKLLILGAGAAYTSSANNTN